MSERRAAYRAGPSEAQIQRAITDYLRWRGWLVVRQNSGALLNPAGRPVRFGTPGLPDLLCLRRGDPALFVEVKRPGQRPRQTQTEMMRLLERHGARCLVATSVEDVIAALGEIA